jgi:methyl-accepting chemotaxis protein
MTTEQESRRTTLIIDPALQQRLIKDATWVPTLALIVGTIMILVSLWIILQGAESAGVDLPWIYVLLVSMVGLVFIASCYVTRSTAVRLSNQIAGPLFRLGQAMERAQKGDMDCRLEFRKDDYLHQTGEVFNGLLAHMKTICQNASPMDEGKMEADKQDSTTECAVADKK